MRIADRMDNIYSNSTFSFRGGPVNGATPIEIGVIPHKYKYVKLSKGRKSETHGRKQVLCLQELAAVPKCMHEERQKIK